MKFEPSELRLLLDAALHGATGEQPVTIAALAPLFDRPGRLLRTVRELERGGFITFDPYQNVVRLRIKPIVSALHQFSQTPELFTQERPLDAVLAETDRLPAKPPDPPARLRSFVRPSIPPRKLPSPILPDDFCVHSPQPTAGNRRFCLDDGYIADKFAATPGARRLRTELAAQATVTARLFQTHFESKPAEAREDIAWCLEAKNPGARLNTHMAMLAQQRQFGEFLANDPSSRAAAINH